LAAVTITGFTVLKTRAPSSRTLVVTTLLIMAIMGAGVLRADYRTEFRKGMNAYLRGNRWAEAEESLRQAIAENGSESFEQINIYGTIYVPYAPHFFRGVALSNLPGRCNDVRSELAISEGQGTIRKFATDKKFATEYATLIRIRNVCPPPVVTSTATPDRPPPVAAPTPGSDTREPSHPGLLSTMSLSTSDGKAIPPILPPPTPTLSGKTQALQVALRDARTLLGNSNGALPRMRDSRTKLSKVISTAANALTSQSPGIVDGARTSLIASSNEYRLVLNSLPPPVLTEAINEYAAGHYDQAVNLLAKSTSSDRVYRAQMVLFRAAARYSQYVVDGEQNAALKKLALDDVKEYRRLEPRLPLNTRYFSPRFRSLVAQTVH
jgi:hypothetical protein